MEKLAKFSIVFFLDGVFFAVSVLNGKIDEVM